MKCHTKLLLSISTFLVGYPNGASCTDYTYDPIDKVIPGMYVSTQVMSLSFQVSMDPNTVHSHKTRMNWSKIRHSEEYDPADPNGSIEEPDDNEKRPTLCHTFIRRLTNQLFSSLAAQLPLEEAQRVMSWKKEGAFTDMTPFCNVTKHEEQPIKDNNSNEIIVPEYSNLKEVCSVDFLKSLFPYYGIGFNLKVSMSDKPMSELTYDDIMERMTPDHRGKTQPIRTTDANVEATLMSPDFTSEDLSSASYKRKAHLILEESNVENAVRILLDRSKVLFGGIFPTQVKKKYMGSMEVELENIPIFGQEKVLKEDFNDTSDIDPSVLALCDHHGLDADQCRQVQKMIEDEADQISQQKDDKESLSKNHDANKYGDTKETTAKQTIQTDRVEKKSYYGTGRFGKDLSDDEKSNMEKQFQALDNFLNAFDSSEDAHDVPIEVDRSPPETNNDDDESENYNIDDLDVLLDGTNWNDLQTEYDTNSMAGEL